MHPNSLANLRKPWLPGETGHLIPKWTGPIVTPALRRYAAGLTPAELRSIDLDTLRTGEAIAVTMLRLALQWSEEGDKARQQVLDRLDGRLAAPAIEDNRIQILVREYGGGLRPEEIG